MKNELFSDAQLQAALAKSQQSFLDSLPQEPPRHEFSKDFQRDIQALSQKEKRILHMRTVTRQVRAASLALIIGASLVLTVHADARATVLRWVKEELGQSSVFWFMGDTSQKLPNYALTWLPEGMECTSDETTNTDRGLVYLDPECPESGFVLHYSLVQDGSQLIVFHENQESQAVQVEINSCTGELFLSEGEANNVLVWFDEKRNVEFDITSPLNSDVILHIAEGIILEE